jgi:glycosyltransferase involved in cell wall biosynthesis
MTAQRRPRVTFVVMLPDHMGGTELATFQVAEQLADRYEVEILGVAREGTSPFFADAARVRVRYLVDRTDEVSRLGDAVPDLAVSDAADLDRRPPVVIDPAWEGDISLLTELTFEEACARSAPDVVVATTPPLLALATRLSPRDTVVIGIEHRSTVHRGSSGKPLLEVGADADAIISLTSEGADWLRAALDPNPPRLPVIPNMIRDAFAPRSSLTEPVIASAGRRTSGKQYDHLVRAFAPVAASHPEWTLRLFGSGPTTESLERLIARLDLRDQVWLAPPVPDIPTEWAKVSIVAMTSQFEGLPLIALESLAAGVPLVSYDCPSGPRHIIDHEVNGLLVPPGDIEAMTAALSRLVEDADARRSMGAAAFESRQRFLPDTVARQWCDLIDSLLDERSRLPSRRQRALDRGRWATPRRPVLAVPARTPAEERNDTVARVVAALDAVGATWFAVRHETPPVRLAVDDTSRVEWLRALAAAHPHGELEVTPMAPAPRDVTLYTGVDPIEDLLRVEPGVRVAATSDDRWPDRALCVGVEVMFWSGDDDHLATRRETESATRLPRGAIGSSTVEVAGHQAPSHPAFTSPAVDTIDFPIDVVYTWVDGSDPQWRERRDRRHRHVDGVYADGAGDERFRDLEELRYSLRSLHAHAPWVNHIWLVTDDQTPAWLDASAPGLTVVSHRDIFRDPSHLPTFNSHSIEANLHHIEGLSNHFLYLNDDVLLGREVPPQKFFTANGSTVHHLSPVPLGWDTDADQSPHVVGAIAARELIRRRFGRSIQQRLLHTPHPLRRDVLDEMEVELADTFRASSAEPFRGSGSVPIPSVLYPYWAYLTGRGHLEGSLAYTFINTARSRYFSRYDAALETRRYDVVALGDHRRPDVEPEEQRGRARDFMERLLPVASPWERGAPEQSGGRGVPS